MEGVIVPKCIFGSLPRTVRGTALVLGGDPKNKNFLYTNGNTVYIRDIENPLNCDVYTQHSVPVTVAKYNPAGTYIASGDERGKIRIWDTTQKEHILKYEYQPLSGSVSDIAWTSDSKRMAVVGDGREKFASVFLWDSGSSVGSFDGHYKKINSVDFRPERPFKAVTASEDFKLCFFDGPPYKYNHSMSDHTGFVNCVRYSPDGSRIVSGSTDGRAFLYDGKTGEKVGELGSPKAHKGGIYAVSFSPDSSQVLTASGDKTCKIFSVESGECVVEFPMGNEIENQQLGCLWQGENMISVSLSGQINYLDRNNPQTPSRIIKGHSKQITALCVSEDKSTIYTGSMDGLINFWDPVTGDCDNFRGKGHANQIQDMTSVDDTLISVAMDDTIRFTSSQTKEYSASVKLASQPRAVAAVTGGLVAVACINEVAVFQNQKQVFSLKVDYEPSSVAIHPGRTEVSVGGGARDMSIHVYELNNSTLKEQKVLKHSGQVNDLKYSPDGAYLAAVDSNRRVILYTLPEYEAKFESTMHTARVNSVAWTSDSQHLATGSLDSNVCVWNLTKFNDPVVIKGAHLRSNISRVGWVTDNTVVSVAHDSTVRQWDIAH